jgi:hypothetical protein
MLFAGGKIILQKSENELQRSIFRLNKLCILYNIKISLNKIQIMIVRKILCKITNDDQWFYNDFILVQVLKFNYLRFDVTINFSS